MGALTVDADVQQVVGAGTDAMFGVVAYLTTADRKTGSDPLPFQKRLLIYTNADPAYAALDGQAGLPGWFYRFIAVCELAGALGLILPGALSIRPRLTAWAAAGLVVALSAPGASGSSRASLGRSSSSATPARRTPRSTRPS